jgi:hypothetical protein
LSPVCRACQAERGRSGPAYDQPHGGHIGLVAIILLFAILMMLVVVPVAVVAATRAVARTYDSGRREPRMVEPALDDRLTRIEEAIDAMAMQIETMTRQQRALLRATNASEEDTEPR